MGNRKQNLKKYLGLSEYPWSSDDDEEVQQQPSQGALQREDREARTSVADIPGTSGTQTESEQQSPVQTRKIQDRIDRDLFWSIINNSARPSSNNAQPSPESTTVEQPAAATQRAASNRPHQSARPRLELRIPEQRTSTRRSDRHPTPEDIQRIIAFKRLTRSLQNLAHHRANNNVGPAPSNRVGPASQRAPRAQERAGTHCAPGTAAGAAAAGPGHVQPPFACLRQAAAPRRPVAPGLPAPPIRPMAPAQGVAPTRPMDPRQGAAPTRPVAPDQGAAPTRPMTPSQSPPSLPPDIAASRFAESLVPNYGNFAQSMNGFRRGMNFRRPFRRYYSRFPTTNEPAASSGNWQYGTLGLPMAPTNTYRANPGTNQMPADPFVHVVDHSEDELQPAVPPGEPENRVNDNAEDLSQNATVSGARLMEEVVEIDAPDGENNPPPPGTEGEEEMAEPNAENNVSGETINSEENAEAVQPGPSFQGVKRKRDPDDLNETFSVQEFNQSLLRLLECPVCLEWMEPPISQCRRGHLVCSRCRARLAACPVCRTPFSSVRNRAMEGVAEMLRYPCRHGCGREVRLRRRAPHEASCGARRYLCPAPACARHPALPRDELQHHFQCKHLSILKIGGKHKFSMKVNSEQHDTWLIMALDEYFHLRVDVDMRTWGVIVYVAYIGPKRNAKSYTYEVTIKGQHNSRKLVYTRSTHSDLESSSVNVNLSRQGCFHLIPDQAVNFLRFKNRHCEPEKVLDFDVEITKRENVDDSREDSES